ncbi:exopolysaccharide biosynthesis protein [Paenibacillus shirakamiensis]|uniref:Exopolysaccharide biosynthesis protein n=1 Tax=Paenibacillus shirakamiensis TaxID=1265935 RepID=A0ABS4JJB0_9BACL|nr:stalk domain-containing protein [Paenibacillus shirakamiensis]MBP2001788.1 exopolysaccharide biosynthesis protein [Paenibacillus shirakamiensis]
MTRRWEDKSRLLAASRGRQLALLSLAGLIWIQPVISLGPITAGSAAYAASTPTVKVGEEIITSGAKLLHYQYTTPRASKILADVIQVDLTNPYVKLDVMTGKGGQVTTRQSVQGMAQETKAVAGINADYFNVNGQGVPMGASVSEGAMITSPSQLQGMYAFSVSKKGTPSIDQYIFDGTVRAEDGSTFTLAGINKESYFTEPSKSYSHVNAMYIYTSAWKSADRPKDSGTTPTEVLVRNGVIQQISPGAAIAGDVPSDGYILRAHGTAATYISTHMGVGQKLDANYQLVSATNGSKLDPADQQMMVGGHTLLVEQGKVSSFTRSTTSISGASGVARTAVGYSKDGKTAYLITAQKNASSSGMTLAELQNFMTSIGIWKGLNLDGGGSTTMVNRPLAETGTQLSFTTSNGSTTQRLVASGLGVYSEAPKGTLKGLIVSGTNSLLIGQEAKYTLKGYDNFYNPVDASGINANWKSSAGSLVWTGNSFKAVKAGATNVTAASGQASASVKVNVLGGADLTSLSTNVQSLPLTAGTSAAVQVTAMLKNGGSAKVPADALNWEMIGFKGSVKNGTLSVNSVNSNAKVGYAIARYDGFSTVIVLSQAGQQTWEDFENTSYPFTFSGLPAEASGTVQVTAGSGDHAGSKVLQLNYNLTGGVGNKYAYAQFNGSVGKAIPAKASSMSVDVFGDSSLNWLRAEFDVNGKAVYADLARPLDFTGWKTLNVDLSSSGLGANAKLKRLYVVNLADGQDERALTGSIAFDNIRFTVPGAGANSGQLNSTVVMTVGQKSLTASGKKVALDVAPIIKGDTTYVPIRYVLDYFGGQANWDGATQKITVLRGNTMIDLTVGQKDFILNGLRKQAAVSPLIMQNRTLVPLRMVSETLGISVKWEQNTKSITLQS